MSDPGREDAINQLVKALSVQRYEKLQGTVRELGATVSFQKATLWSFSRTHERNCCSI